MVIVIFFDLSWFSEFVNEIITKRDDSVDGTFVGLDWFGGSNLSKDSEDSRDTFSFVVGVFNGV